MTLSSMGFGGTVAASGPAPVRRSYHSPQRTAAALDTRRRIRAAAAELFLAKGYSATSIRAVAQEAGVAEKTIYLQFVTKGALLKEVVETAIVGDDEALPAAERPWFLDILTASDPSEKLRLLARATTALHERSGALFAMARGAAAVDPEVEGMWAGGKQGHRADMTVLAENLAAALMVPRGRDLDWAIDTLYVLIGPETWHLIRTELHRDEAAYSAWLLDNLTQIFGRES